jgi:hypothetical protein
MGKSATHKNFLLSASTRVGTSNAGTSLRAWFHSTPTARREERGIQIDEKDVVHSNSECRDPMPVYVVDTTDLDGRTVRLCVFLDGSAVVARTPHPGKIYRGSDLDVLPVALRLTSIARPLDGSPAAQIEMRKANNSSAQPTLRPEGKKDGWISLDASGHNYLDAITYDYRQSFRDALLAEAIAWSSALSSPRGLRASTYGRPVVVDKISDDAPIHPAFMPCKPLDDHDLDIYHAFMRDITTWMAQKTGGDSAGLDISVFTPMLTQTNGNMDMKVVVSPATGGATTPPSKQLTRHLSQIARTILNSSAAPIPAAQIVGQDELVNWHRSSSSQLVPHRIGPVFEPKGRTRSGHEMLLLERRFAGFWKPVPSD